MPRARPLTDRQETLLASQRELLAEIAQLRREEEYLVLKVRQAREQARYYEGLLTLMRRDFGNVPSSDLMRRFG
ncbi:MAG TPA: hypothetical protein VEE83_02160 [Thermoplasmata archaeon]|nr:hypothetical protein [Thermoplasmata archaeon]HYB77471.1 hypothetical protein [Thermoplasmata archaeon]